MRTRFLNVDFDIAHDRSIEPLIDWLDRHALVLHRSETSASIELSENLRSIGAIAHGFAALIDQLPDDLRALWDGCEARHFNVGIQAGDEPRAAEFRVSSQALARIQKMGAEIVFTVYAPHLESN